MVRKDKKDPTEPIAKSAIGHDPKQTSSTSKGQEQFTINVNVKCTLVQALRLCTGRTAQRGSRGIALLFLDHSTRRGEGSASRPGRTLPRERPGTHCTGGWVGPKAGPDRCGKSRSSPGFDTRIVQAVASRYTDYATWLMFTINSTLIQCSISCLVFIETAFREDAPPKT